MTLPTTADVVVIGGGIAGLAAARELATRGVGRVLVVERLGKAAAEIDDTAQRAQVGPGAGVALDDQLDGRVVAAGRFEVGVAHGGYRESIVRRCAAAGCHRLAQLLSGRNDTRSARRDNARTD